MPLLSENLVEMVELAQGADCYTSNLDDTTLANSSHASKRVPSSSRSTPPSALLIPLAPVQKFEAQMATLVHHMQSCMQKSIDEVEEHIEKRVAQQIEQKIQAVPECLNAFELCVPSSPAPMIHLTTLHEAAGSLYADVDAILNMRGTKWEMYPLIS